jgi:defect-in-organelle-trafficking protein DotC
MRPLKPGKSLNPSGETIGIERKWVCEVKGNLRRISESFFRKILCLMQLALFLALVSPVNPAAAGSSPAERNQSSDAGVLERESQEGIFERKPKDLLELRALTYQGLLDGQKPSPLRQTAQRAAALGAAAQAGARWRYQKILNEVVEPLAPQLDDLFDFGDLVTKKGPLVILPPVVTGAGEAMRLNNPSQGSSQEKSYRFVRPAMMVSVVPNWRHYLLTVPSGPGSIHPSLRPVAAEIGRWRKFIDEGWVLGIREADRLFNNNTSLLARDYAGMMMFKRLVSESLALEPVTEEQLIELEVKEQEIVFNKSLYRLNEKGRFVEPASNRTQRPKKK